MPKRNIFGVSRFLRFSLTAILFAAGVSFVGAGPMDGNKAYAWCAECTSECRTHGRWDCWGHSGQICIPCGMHPGGVCTEVGSGFMQGNICRYCTGKCTMSAFGVGDPQPLQVSNQPLANGQQPGDANTSKMAFRLEFSPADAAFVSLAQALPTHASALLAYWFDEAYRAIPLHQTTDARYLASPELSELHVLRVVKHAENPEQVARLMDDPANVEYQLALPMTEELEVDLFRLSDARVGLSIVSYRASDEQELAQTLVIAQQTERPGHYVISSVESTVLAD